MTKRFSYSQLADKINDVSLGTMIKDYTKNIWPVLMDGDSKGFKFKVSSLNLRENLDIEKRFVCVTLNDTKFIDIFNSIDNVVSTLLDNQTEEVFTPSVSPSGRLLRLYLPQSKSGNSALSFWDKNRNKLSIDSIDEGKDIEGLVRIKYIHEYKGSIRMIWELLQVGLTDEKTPIQSEYTKRDYSINDYESDNDVLSDGDYGE